MAKKISGKIVLVPAGDSELAQSIALDLAKFGAHIVLVYQRSDLNKLKKQIEKLGSKCLLIEGPINNDILNRVIKEFNHLDILIHTISKKKMKDQSTTICLNMIVKNESSVIERCLNSVLPLIDSWVIVDTGSTDGTQKIIKKCLKSVPGELHQRKWVDFVSNRNEALELAKGKAEYTLLMDADDFLFYTEPFVLPKLDHDFYYIKSFIGPVQFGSRLLIKDSLDWVWEGQTQEIVTSKLAKRSQFITGLTKICTYEGFRAKDPLKFKKESNVLETAVHADPQNARNTYYLGESYRRDGNLEKALKIFEKRVKMGGSEEEIYLSYLEIGAINDCLKRDPALIEKSYKRGDHI